MNENKQIKWVQLPFAGVEPFIETIREKPDLTWTCGKGVYSKPCAEQILALALAGFRGIGTYARASSWSPPQGRNLYGSRVTVLGGGGITRELLPMLAPFQCDVTVIRRSSKEPMPGANRVLGSSIEELHSVLPTTDLLVLALSLTPATCGIIGEMELSLMPNDSWIINLARGKHIDTDALVAALQAGTIGGAGLDVTEPEPLPDGHALWSFENVLITPHIGNTPEMGLPLLAERVRENVDRYVKSGGSLDNLIGYIDVEKGY